MCVTVVLGDMGYGWAWQCWVILGLSFFNLNDSMIQSLNCRGPVSLLLGTEEWQSAR